jgi:hypothetical protein
MIITTERRTRSFETGAGCDTPKEEADTKALDLYMDSLSVLVPWHVTRSD